MKIDLKPNLNDFLEPPDRVEDNRMKINLRRLDGIFYYVKNPIYVFPLDWNLVENGWDKAVPEYYSNENTFCGWIKGIILLADLLHKFAISQALFKNQTPKFTFDVKMNSKLKFSYEEDKNLLNISIPKKWKKDFKILNEAEIRKKSKKWWENGKYFKRADKVFKNEVSGKIFVREGSTFKFLEEIGKKGVEDGEKVSEIFEQIKQSYQNYPLKCSIDSSLKFNVVDFLCNQVIGFNSINGLTRIVYIPGKGFISEGRKEESSMGYIIGATNQTKISIPALQVKSTLESRETSVTDWAEKAVKDLRKEAIKTDAIAITLDTFSHNIAAHSIPSTIAYISKEIEKEPNKEYPLLLRRVLYSYQSLIDTSDFWMEGIRSERSMSGQIISLYDILCDFADNSLFLGTISETEGFTTVIIKIKIPSYDKHKVFAVIDLDKGTIRWGCNKNQKPAFDRFIENKQFGDYETNNGKQLLRSILENEDVIIKNEINLDKLQEMKIYFPGGISGKKALYTIFENALRNGKHLKGRNRDLVLNIEIQSKDKEISPKWDFKVSLEGKSEGPEEGVKKTKNAFEIGIMKDDGSPNMGGSGQMLICAGMLNELTISEIHEKAKKGEYMEFIDVNKSFSNNLEYTTYLWKGAEFVKYSDIKKSLKEGKENIHRFKMLIISKEDRKEMEQFCKNKETYIPVRLIENEGESYEELYKKWLKKLNISLEANNSTTISLAADKKVTECLCSREYKFEHNITDFSMLSCRSNGILVKNFTKDTYLKNQFELIEILETKIEIHDSRIYNFTEKLKKDDKKRSLRNLCEEKINMKIYPDVKNAENINQVIDNNSSHFMVVHISPFINVLNQLNSQEKKKKINVLKKNFKNYNFLVFTSGKGRKEKPIDYSYNIRSIDFANFQNVINITRRLKGEEAFALKYGFIKVLLGS